MNEKSNNSKPVVITLIILSCVFSMLFLIIYCLIFINIGLKLGKASKKTSVTLPPNVYNKTIYNEYKITLDKKDNDANFKDDDVVLHFEGKEEETSYYKYKLNIKIHGINVSNKIFSNDDDLVIYSDNHASSFKFIEFNDYYFFVSSIAKQNNGDYVLVTDKNGKVINEFYDSNITFDKETDLITIEKCDEYETDKCETITFLTRDLY